MRCVNGHPGHDSFPYKGKMWRKYPTFVSDRSGRYRLFDPENDQAIYEKASAEHGETLQELESAFQKIEVDNKFFDQNGQVDEVLFDDVLSFLERCGAELGFKTQRKYEVPMSRIDLVWYLDLPVRLPQIQQRKIPVVGFELETSWQTRKHIKGDIMNLQALRAAHGVILQ